MLNKEIIVKQNDNDDHAIYFVSEGEVEIFLDKSFKTQ